MYYFLRILSFIFCRVSPKAARKGGHILGQILWYLVPQKRKKLSIENIYRANITKDAKIAEKISKEAAVRLGDIGVSMFRFPLLNKENIEKYVTITGKEKLDKIKAMNQGCILAANHCGNWEIEGAALSLFGYSILAVGMEQSNKGFDKFLRKYRSMVGQKVEYKTGVRNIYKRLREGYFVGLLCDQDPGATGILSPLFGEETLTPTGPAHLAIMTDLPVIPVFIHMKENGLYEIVVEDPLYVRQGKSKKEKVQLLTDEINECLEKWIRTYPEEWFWLHNRWKHTDRLYGQKEGTK